LFNIINIHSFTWPHTVCYHDSFKYVSSDSPSAAVERALGHAGSRGAGAGWPKATPKISRKLKIPKSSASYILRTLETPQLFDADEESGKYRVGLRS